MNQFFVGLVYCLHLLTTMDWTFTIIYRWLFSVGLRGWGNHHAPTKFNQFLQPSGVVLEHGRQFFHQHSKQLSPLTSQSTAIRHWFFSFQLNYIYKCCVVNLSKFSIPGKIRNLHESSISGLIHLYIKNHIIYILKIPIYIYM